MKRAKAARNEEPLTCPINVNMVIKEILFTLSALTHVVFIVFHIFKISIALVKLCISKDVSENEINYINVLLFIFSCFINFE